MNEDIKNKLKEYISKYRNYALALNGWVKLKNKNFTTMDALEAVFMAANGKPMEMNNIITTLTKKVNVYGRRGHVYSDVPTTSIDINYDNGKLSVIGYKGVVNEPETNNISPRNPNIFRKSDGQTKVPYQKTSDDIHKIGAFVRKYSPSYGDDAIIGKISAIMNFGQEKKISYDKVMDAIVKGKLAIVGNGVGYKVAPKQRMPESKKIIVGENAIKVFEAIENEMTYYSFLSNVKSFLKDLLNNPSTAKPSMELMAKGFNRSKLLSYLVNKGIITKDEKIVDEDENGNPQTAVMNVKYKVPKKDFDKKMKKLYIGLFEKNLPEPISHNQCGTDVFSNSKYSKLNDDIAIMNNSPLTMGVVGGRADLDGIANILDKGIKNRNIKVEDGGDGATNATSSGQFSQPVFGVQRREIYDTKPDDDIEEATTTMNTGNYQYTVPFPGDKSTLKRKNGKDGSISINRIK